ncbi:uncharacterized protein LOC131605201 [Vicia villosa]|uniref:uncharacterized protein LOC131605201 n=1 Tax=Vicia villosa TaxID=3911 RepID=UPI00273ACEEA|nr:uncharacterized protein LOC131605201 [Vicia villosa]
MKEPWLHGGSEGVIRNLFDDADTEKILQVALLEEVIKDIMIWKEEHDGIYSVRTSYKLWGYLPTRARLRQHFGMFPLAYHMCENITEDEWHLFLDYNEDIRLACRFAVMIDVIWKNRNDFVWHNELEEVTKLDLCVVHQWNDWFQAQEHTARNVRLDHALEWSPPSVGRLKSEALALKEAILEAISSHLEFVTFESASQIVTQAIHSNRKGDFKFSLIIESIVSLLHFIPNFKVKFVKRQANMVAHSLARAANS